MKKITFAVAVFTLFLTAFYSSANAQCSMGNNRIVNGNAEGNPGATGNNVDVAVWGNETTGFTVAPYGTVVNSGIPGPYAAGPPASERGGYLFYGGTNSADSAADQNVNVSDCSAEIDGGSLRFDANGYFGGYENQADNASLTLKFQNSTGVVLRTLVIGAVTANDRENDTGMNFQGRTGLVPVGTRNVNVRLSLDRVNNGNNNGYADNLQFVINAPSANCQFGTNLIVNGDAEADQTIDTEVAANHKVANWDVETGGFTVWGHGNYSSYYGNYYFSGGNGSASDYARQYIDISECVAQIDSNSLGYGISGDFGGWEDQDDRANLNITFLDNFEQPIGTATVGGVLARDREYQTMLLSRSNSGMIPFGTRTIKVDLVMTRVEGLNNNGYADNVAFFLTTPIAANAIDAEKNSSLVENGTPSS